MIRSRLTLAAACCVAAAGCGEATPNGPLTALSATPTHSAGWTTYPAAVEPGWKFADLRTNDLNSGSMFEPCTAYTPAELRMLGLDASTAMESSPHVDEDHERGCIWDSVGSPLLAMSQGVVNYGENRDDVETNYQRDYVTEFTFLPNEFRAGRIVATWRSSLDGRCNSEFEAEGAILTTEGLDMRSDGALTTEQVCEWIRPFVDLALTKALPP